MNGSISGIIKCAVLNYDIRAFHPCLLRVCSDGRHIVRRVFTATKITVANEYDWSVFNAARSYQNHTQEIAAPSFEQGEEAYSPLMNKYQEAISITEHYRETKSRFTWIGEIEDERLLSALENLSDADLELITLYAYEEYDTVEISKVFGTTKQNISKKIRRITNFIKNFQIEVV